MDGCSSLQFIAKFGFIPKGILDTPLDRLRSCIRKQYLKQKPINLLASNISDLELENWNDLHKILSNVTIYPL